MMRSIPSRWGAAVALACLLLAGCTTTYGPMGYTGGYTDTQIEEDVYRVRFSGNGMTTKDMVWQYWIYRCAELTTQKGYTHFMLLRSDEQTPVPQASSAPDGKPAYRTTASAADDDALSRITPTATTSAPVFIYVPTAPVIKYANEGRIKLVKNPAAYPGRTLVRADVVLRLVGPFVRSAGKERAPSDMELLKLALIIVPGPPRGRVTLDDLKYLLPPL